MSAKVQPLHSSSSKELDAILARLKAPTLETLRALLTDMFNGADDALFALAEQAGSNRSQASYFDAMRLLRLRRQELLGQFVSEIDGLFRSTDRRRSEPGRRGPGRQQPRDGDFEMVDPEVMERSVALKNMSEKARGMFPEEIAHLETRIEWLGYRYGTSIDKQLIDPHRVCEAFGNAIDGLELALESKLVIFKLFEQKVVSRLGGLYERLNQILIDAGVLPQIKLTRSFKSQGRYQKAASEDGDESEGDGGSSVVDSELPQEALDVINGIIKERPRQYRNDEYTPDSINESLRAVQSELPQETEEPVTPAQIKETVVNRITEDAKAEDREVARYDEKLIDLVSAMFDFIYNNGELSDSVKALLSRLQIPYIKAALVDSTLLQDDEHVARLFLNQVTHTSIGIQQRDDPLYEKVAELVEMVAVNFHDNMELFNFALQDLERIRDEEEDKARTLEEQIQAEAQEESRRLLARKMVLYEIKKFLGDRSLPADLHPLLLKGWAPLMMLRHLKHGRKAEEWREVARLLEQIILCIFPLDSVDKFRRFKKIRADLPEVIESLLGETYRQEQAVASALQVFRTEYFTRRQREFEEYQRAKESPASAVASVEAAAEPEPEPVEAAADQEDDPEEPEQAFIRKRRESLEQLPADVKPGTWFEIYTGEQSAVRRLRLSTIIEETAQLVFVDRSGRRVLDKEADHFAMELKNGNSRMINDDNIFERALLSVITSMRSEESNPASSSRPRN